MLIIRFIVLIKLNKKSEKLLFNSDTLKNMGIYLWTEKIKRLLN